jgi:hypothetical protein
LIKSALLRIFELFSKSLRNSCTVDKEIFALEEKKKKNKISAWTSKASDNFCHPWVFAGVGRYVIQ